MRIRKRVLGHKSRLSVFLRGPRPHLRPPPPPPLPRHRHLAARVGHSAGETTSVSGTARGEDEAKAIVWRGNCTVVDTGGAPRFVWIYKLSEGRKRAPACWCQQDHMRMLCTGWSNLKLDWKSGRAPNSWGEKASRPRAGACQTVTEELSIGGHFHCHLDHVISLTR